MANRLWKMKVQKILARAFNNLTNTANEIKADSNIDGGNVYSHPVMGLITDVNHLSVNDPLNAEIQDVVAIISKAKQVMRSQVRLYLPLYETVMYLEEYYHHLKADKKEDAYIAWYFAIQAMRRIGKPYGRYVVDILPPPEDKFSMDADLLPEDVSEDVISPSQPPSSHPSLL